MSERILTSVRAVVDPSREAELTSSFRVLSGGALPAGLLRTELLRGQNGVWRIQSLWLDRDSLLAVREHGVRPAALELFERVGADHTHEVFSVEHSRDA